MLIPQPLSSFASAARIARRTKSIDVNVRLTSTSSVARSTNGRPAVVPATLVAADAVMAAARSPAPPVAAHIDRAAPARPTLVAPCVIPPFAKGIGTTRMMATGLIAPASVPVAILNVPAGWATATAIRRVDRRFSPLHPIKES